MTSSVIPWSWSTLQAYETCPRQYYERYILKAYKEPESEHLVWGNAVHKALEISVSTGVALPENMVRWTQLADKLHNAPGTKYCEVKTAVNERLLPTDFFGHDCWNRGVDDLLIINGSNGMSLDYKTGKEGKLSDQLAIGAARAFAKFPQLQKIDSAFAWLSTGKYSRAIYTREDVPGIWERMQPRVAKMLWSMQHNVWPMNPSGLCKRSKKPGSTYMGCPAANCPNSEYYRKPQT
jgi:hypothetical protein